MRSAVRLRLRRRWRRRCLAGSPLAGAEPPPALIEATEEAAALCRDARRHAGDPRRLPDGEAT